MIIHKPAVNWFPWYLVKNISTSKIYLQIIHSFSRKWTFTFHCDRDGNKSPFLCYAIFSLKLPIKDWLIQFSIYGPLEHFRNKQTKISHHWNIWTGFQKIYFNVICFIAWSIRGKLSERIWMTTEHLLNFLH